MRIKFYPWDLHQQNATEKQQFERRLRGKTRSSCPPQKSPKQKVATFNKYERGFGRGNAKPNML